MAPKVAAVRKTSHKFTLITLTVIVSLVLLFIIWANFANLDVISRGQGQVIPSQQTQVISNLEGGIVKQILVKEGELVEAGQPLMHLDSTMATSRYQANREEYLRYLSAVARLQAQLDNKPFQVPAEVSKEAPKIAEEETARYQKRMEQLKNQQTIAEDVIKQKQQALDEDKERLRKAEEQFRLADDELKMVSPLVAQELISKREILRLKRDIASIEGDVATQKASLLKDQAAIAQAQSELEQVKNRFQYEDQEQLKDLSIKLAAEHGEVLETKDRLTRTEIRSPVKGIVKEVKFKTVGGVVRPGEEIFTVVPYEDNLFVEARIAPSDIAFIRPGQEAHVKISTYDYTIYGSLKGHVVEVSADTIHDPEQKRDFYRVLIQTNKNYLEYKGEKHPIKPGLTVQADILTGQRTVMSYLLKPFKRGTEEAFTEK